MMKAISNLRKGIFVETKEKQVNSLSTLEIQFLSLKSS